MLKNHHHQSILNQSSDQNLWNLQIIAKSTSWKSSGIDVAMLDIANFLIFKIL